MTLVLDAGALVAAGAVIVSSFGCSRTNGGWAGHPVPMAASWGRSGAAARDRRASPWCFVDAALVLLAAAGDELVTSHPEDLTFLASAAGAHVELNLV